MRRACSPSPDRAPSAFKTAPARLSGSHPIGKIWRNAEDLHPIRNDPGRVGFQPNPARLSGSRSIRELGLKSQLLSFRRKKSRGAEDMLPKRSRRGSIRFRNGSSSLVWFTPLKFVGVEGFAPTQHKAPGLQPGSALSLRRTPIAHTMKIGGKPW